MAVTLRSRGLEMLTVCWRLRPYGNIPVVKQMGGKSVGVSPGRCDSDSYWSGKGFGGDGVNTLHSPCHGLLFPVVARHQSSKSVTLPSSLVPQTSLSRPPWPEVACVSPEEQRRRHAAVVEKVNGLIAAEHRGRLFAVVHFASRQWKVTSEDLILVENHLEAECGERIRMEKVLLVGGQDFTLVGRPLLGKHLVRVEATVIEKTESWPKIHMKFWKRHRFQRKKVIIQPQTVLRINTVELAPRLT